MADTVIVINPFSGKGRAAQNAPIALRRFRERGLAVDVLEPRTAQDSTRMVTDAVARGVKRVIACGGDGTVNLVLQCLVDTDVEMGIVPVGTGDDIARALGLPLDDPAKAADIIVDGRTRSVDVGRVTAADGTSKAFLAIVSAGFDSQVNERANALKWPTGESRYMVAILAELGFFKPIDYRMTIDGRTTELAGMLIAVGNGPSYGGGMKVCPGAAMDDGQLDVTVLGKVSKLTFLRVFPSVFKGTHINHPSVTTQRGTQVRIEAEGQVAYADGDRVGPLPVDVSIATHELQVLAPVD